MKLAICTVSPPGYVHSAAFREVAETLHAAARELGHDVQLTTDSDLPGYRTVVLGTNLLLEHPQRLASDAILYNLEQVQTGPWFNEKVLALFRQYEVWDYSDLNASTMSQLGLPRPKVVPIGWHPQLRRIEPKQEDIDVLFYGCMNDRRTRIIEQLQRSGVKVQTLFGVYGKERDEFIARSKIVLNIHYYAARVFEIVRASYLLTNGRLLLSERGASTDEERPFESGIAFSEYDNLVPRCLELLAHPDERAQIAKNGQQVMESRQETGYLECALASPAMWQTEVNLPKSAPLLTVGERLDKPVPSYYGWARPEVVAKVPTQGAAILDVGCAAGAMGHAMLNAGAREVVGLDVVPDAVRLARSRLTAAYLFDANVPGELPYPAEYFDVITFADVLEHLPYPDAAIRHLLRWLKPGGTIVCSIPNVRHESVLLPLLLDGAWNYADAGILDRTHLRFFTLDSIQRFFGSLGLKLDTNVEAVHSPPSPRLEKSVELVRALGANADQYRLEACVIQYILTLHAKDRPSVGTRPVILDPWRGSRPNRLLIAPQLNDHKDCWQQILGLLSEPGALDESTTVGVAIPMKLLDEAPPAILEVAARNTLDLLFMEAPTDAYAWKRVLGGAHSILTTSKHAVLRAEAQALGVAVVDGTALLRNSNPSLSANVK